MSERLTLTWDVLKLITTYMFATISGLTLTWDVLK